MKKFKSVLVIAATLFLLVSLSASAKPSDELQRLVQIVQAEAPVGYGYVDNTAYYKENYFSSLSYVDECYIATCTESTNFNEFGIFHVKEVSDVKACEKQLNLYVKQAKQRFQSGVVYDIEQFPKFENAKVISCGQYVFYMIFTQKEVHKVEKAIYNALK